MAGKRRSTPGGPTLPPGVKGVRKRLAGGGERLYFYHRRTGRPIKAALGTPQFQDAMREAAVPLPAARPSTLDIEWLIGRWQASPEWTQSAAASKTQRRSYLKRITERFRGALVEYFD